MKYVQREDMWQKERGISLITIIILIVILAIACLTTIFFILKNEDTNTKQTTEKTDLANNNTNIEQTMEENQIKEETQINNNTTDIITEVNPFPNCTEFSKVRVAYDENNFAFVSVPSKYKARIIFSSSICQ